MLWRLQGHSSVDQLVDEVIVAFPDLVHQFMPDEYSSAEDILDICIESRFVRRFLEFWGFVIMAPHRRFGDEATSRSVELQPLLEQTFRFSV